MMQSSSGCCISFDSYIKPQRKSRSTVRRRVVYLLTPTSNHNLDNYLDEFRIVVYLLTPTSNHNHILVKTILAVVVYLLTPTSNHNRPVINLEFVGLYIF